MKHCSNTFLLVAAAVLIASAASAAQESAGLQNSAPLTGLDQQPVPNDYSDQIIWSFEDPSSAMFIPQRELDRVPLDDLPITATDANQIRDALRSSGQGEAGHHRDHCLHESYPDSAPPVTGQETIGQWVAAQELAFVGTVVDMVPGWSAWLGYPATMVYLRVDEILRNKGDSYNEAGFLQLGQIVAYQEDQANIQLYGRDVYSKLPEGAAVAQTGEKVLFTGDRYGQHPLFLSRKYVFALREGKVLPLPWTLFKNTQGVSLQALREAVLREGSRRSR